MERRARVLGVLPLLLFVTVLVGCAHLELAPRQRVLFVHKELPAASRAVDAARQAGKDRQCPEAFQEAERLKDQAWSTYWACNTAEAIRLANEAVAKTNALCPVRATPSPAPPPAATVTLSATPAVIVQGQCTSLTWSSTNATAASIDPGVGPVDPNGSRQVCPPSTTQYAIAATGPGGRGTAAATVTVNPPPPPAAAPPPPPAAPAPPPPPAAAAPPAPPPPPAATVTLSATPAVIVQGQCSSLTWSSTNATAASIDPGVGPVGPSGSRQVCPASTTRYAIAATGPGGQGTAAATVTVNPPPPPAAAPAPRVVDRLTIQLHFDFDKATIRPADQAELDKAVAFVKKYPAAKISVVGHTDSIGTEAYNQGLSERRAAAVKDYLVKQGAADAQRITTAGNGETRPVASNATPEGRAQNRRAEVQILSE
jgi:outer membrane protein OmpA-like peptidoglycan-associated protein